MPILNKILFLKKISLSYFSLILLGIYGIFYVGNALSPSSYGVFLERIGAKSEGLVWGTPRSIRSDEWGVHTPLIQVAVNNNFERYNKTSPYKEDLRSNYSLPLKDWSIPFKPALLGFYILPPAYAFSSYHFLIMAAFLTGFAILFHRLGAPHSLAIGLSLLTYFSSFIQNWWSTAGMLSAFFPWIYIAIVSNKPLAVRAALFYYSVSCMLFSIFYPPIFYAFAFTIFLFLYSFHRSYLNLKNLVTFGACAILAVLTYLFYIQDSLVALSNTIYPGHRSSSGGEVSLIHLIAHLFPSLNINISKSVTIGAISNVCEMSVVGSYLFLLIIIFGRWKNFWKNISYEEIKSLSCLSLGFLLINAWMLLPIPASFVKIILLDRAPGVRCLFAYGLILIGIAIIILKRLEFTFTTPRLILFVSCVFGASAFSAIHYNAQDVTLVFEGLVILCPLAIFFLITHNIFTIDKKYFTHSVLALALINNVIVFGAFNPLQSAKPIFKIPQTPFVKSLKNKENFNAEGFFIGEGLPGATANGLGLPSIGHVLYVPQLKFFRCYFPELPEEEFNIIFNRYLHVSLQNSITKPINVRADQSFVPLQTFTSTENRKELHKCLGL